MATEGSGSRAFGGLGLPCAITQAGKVQLSQLICVKEIRSGHKIYANNVLCFLAVQTAVRLWIVIKT